MSPKPLWGKGSSLTSSRAVPTAVLPVQQLYRICRRELATETDVCCRRHASTPEHRDTR